MGQRAGQVAVGVGLGEQLLGLPLESSHGVGPGGPAHTGPRPSRPPRPAATDFHPEWSRVAADIVSQLGTEVGRRPDDRLLNELIGELTTRSQQFSALWATHDVRWRPTGTKRFHHRVVGGLTPTYEGLALAADPGQTLITFTAEPGSSSQQALTFLASWAPTASRAADHRANEDHSA